MSWIGEIIRICLRVGCNNARGNDLREAALMVSGDLIASLPTQVVEDGLVQDLVNACFQLCADPTDDAVSGGDTVEHVIGWYHVM